MGIERFEYRTETYSPGANKLLTGGYSTPRPFAEWLNDQGKLGWLLVSMTEQAVTSMRRDYFCVFSRRVEAGPRICTHCNSAFDDDTLCKCGRKQT
jgi:hypothetical protein